MEFADLLRGNCFPPSLRRAFKRPVLHVTKRGAVRRKRNEPENGLEGCEHKYESSSQLFKTCILVGSCKHGFILFAVLLPFHESLTSLYQLFSSRLRPLIQARAAKADPAPLHVVYDNACALWAYIYKRDPWLASWIM